MGNSSVLERMRVNGPALCGSGASRRRPQRLRRAATRGWVVAICATVLLLVGCGSDPVPAPSHAVGQQLDFPLPPTVLHTPLVSWNGEHLSLAAFRGKVLVISVMMTLCQEECPLDTANVVAGARAVEHAGLGSKVQFVSLTIDPQRDTPSRLRAYRRLYASAPADWTLVTGKRASLARLWNAFGVYVHKVAEGKPPAHDWLTGKPLTYDLTHSDQVIFLDAHQHWRFYLEGVPHVARGAPMPAPLSRFMSSTGNKNLHHPPIYAWGLPQELEVVSWLTNHEIPGSAHE